MKEIVKAYTRSISQTMHASYKENGIASYWD